MAYWFKTRRYGFGLSPATWQGWASLAVTILLVVLPGFWLPDHGHTALHVWFAVWVVLVVVGFLAVVRARGPRMRWRWGRSHEDDSDQDL